MCWALKRLKKCKGSLMDKFFVKMWLTNLPAHSILIKSAAEAADFRES